MEQNNSHFELFSHLFDGDEAPEDVNFQLDSDVLSPDVLSPDVLSPDVLSTDVLSTDVSISNVGRFNTDIGEEDIDHFLQEQENVNTKRKTREDIELFRSFLVKQKQEFREPETLSPTELDSMISAFLLSVRKKNGSEYEPTTLRSYVSSIDRHLREKKYGFSILRDFQFQRSMKVLKSKQKQLKGMGKGNKPFASDELTDDDIEQLINAQQLGRDNPVSLLNSVWLNNCVHFGLRTGRESHELMWGDIILKVDETGEQYLEFSQERQTKTRTGVNPRDVRRSKPRAYATPEMPDRDPVGLYMLYRSKRPSSCCSPDSPFYLNKNVAVPSIHQAWYKITPMGINKLYKIMNEMKAGAKMTNVDKRLTPYSARKHLVQKLNDEGVPPTQIMQISGHKNVQSINNYSKLNSDQSKQISHLLSGRKQDRIVAPVNPKTQVPFTTTTSSETPSMSTPSFGFAGFPGLFVGNTFQSPVTVHFHQHSGPQNHSSSVSNFQITATYSGHFEFALPAEARTMPQGDRDGRPTIQPTVPEA